MSDDAEALYELSRRGKLDKVQELLDRAIPPDAFMAYDGSTALVIAARGGHGKLVKLLVDRGAALHTHTDDGSSVLMHAVSGGSAEAVNVLLAARTDPNETNEDGVTPLILAGDNGIVEVARLLVEANADVGVISEGWGSALDSARAAGHETMVQFLEASGAHGNHGQHQSTGERKIAAGERWGYDAFDGEKDY
mmetsp:Transcript_26185/g.50119  ORF Transcript_26185/g.50119 Transcript_26185/m.50119 type:complete len:194 (+) Transcript_26185:89-670(+)